MSTIINFILLEVGKQALQSSLLLGKTKSLLLPCLLKNPIFLLALSKTDLPCVTVCPPSNSKRRNA